MSPSSYIKDYCQTLELTLVTISLSAEWSTCSVLIVHKKTIAFLTAHVPDFIEPENCPPNSPDLNPVDYSIWGVFVTMCLWPHPPPTSITFGIQWTPRLCGEAPTGSSFELLEHMGQKWNPRGNIGPMNWLHVDIVSKPWSNQFYLQQKTVDMNMVNNIILYRPVCKKVRMGR